MSDDKFIFDFEYKIRKQIQEDEENFVYTTILPFCESITEKKLSKKELEEILRKGMQKSIPLDKVKEAREKISDWDVNEVFDGCSDSYILGVARGLDISRKILDKLIESEG
jgi:hypothetical protein